MKHYAAFILSILLMSSCAIKEQRVEPVHKFDSSLTHYDPSFVSDLSDVKLGCDDNSCEIKRVVPRRVLIIGDSEACAVGLVANDVVKEMSIESGHQPDIFSVVCKGGTTIQYWSNKARMKRVFHEHPRIDVVLVFLGTNHYWQKELPSPKNILDEFDQRGVMCFWVGIVAVKGKKWPISKALENAVTPPCGYFDSESFDMTLWDGYHPDRSNAKKWLKAVWQMIPLKYEKVNYE